MFQRKNMLNYSNEVYMYTYICRSTKVHCHKSFGSCPCCPCSGIYSCSVPLKGFCESGKIGENIYRFKTLLYSVQCTVYSVHVLLFLFVKISLLSKE